MLPVHPFRTAFGLATLFRLADAMVMPLGVALQRLSPDESLALSQECGHSTEALPQGRKHPWAVSFMTKGRNKLGGTIISPYHILTVAHGFLRFDSSAYGQCEVYGYRRFEQIQAGWSVVYGHDCIRAQANDHACAKPNVTRNRIRAIFVDDAFADGGCIQGHDWAIVEVEERIQFSARVQPICLPVRGQPHFADGEVLTVTSWGRRDAFHVGDPLIREIPMRHNPHCKGAPWADSMPTKVEDYLCANALNPRDYNTLRTCHGDSGSGMEWRRGGGTTAAGRHQQQKKRSDAAPKAPASHVLHAPLFIPGLEFMRKWPGSPAENLSTPRPFAPDDEEEEPEWTAEAVARDEIARLLNVAGELDGNGTAKMVRLNRTAAAEWQKAPNRTGEHKWGKEGLTARQETAAAAAERTELVGVTSFGSRQCSSDELARFTRTANYAEKICALTGVCYPLGGTSATNFNAFSE